MSFDSYYGEPAGLSDEELLRVYGLAKRDHCYEGPLDDWPTRAERAATVAGLRAVEAATLARAQRQPEPGEVQKLVKWLQEKGDDYDCIGETFASLKCRRTADLLAQRYPHPVPVSEWQTGLPPSAGFYYVRGLLDESIGGDNRPVFVNPKDFVWGFWELDDPEWIGLDSSEITPENIQWKPLSLMPQPVPVSERPWEREGWCDKQGQCWWFNPGQPAMSNPHIATSSWRLCRMLNGKPMGAYSLPAHALPLPGEVER